MITSFEAELKNFAVHRVGNSLQNEYFSLSESPIQIEDNVMSSLLMHYFLSSFERSNEVYNLYHPSNDLMLNEVYNFVYKMFEHESTFIETSQQLTKYLYSVSSHPKIKSGELYVVLFHNLQIEGELLEAVGIFKSESKESYLKVNQSLDISYEQDGININKLDKGVIIFNTDKESGYKVAVIDNGKSTTGYWMDEFLQLKIRNDNYSKTFNALRLTSSFITQKLDEEFEVSKADKIDLMQRSLKYFKEKETFDLDEFTGEILGNEQAISSFKNYKSLHEQEFEEIIPDTFDIHEVAVKKQQRSFSDLLKLDRNFKVHILGNRDLIEKGFDADKNLNFYKLYYKEEI